MLSRLKSLLQAAAFVTAIFSLATFADQAHRYLELFSHFRLQYLLAAALLAIALFVVRSQRWAAAMLLLTVVNALPVVPWHLSDNKVTASGEPRFKLLSSNVYAGNENSEALLDLITAEQADLVFLQEVTSRRAKELAQLHEAYPYSLNIPREDNFGIAVLSRRPFENARIIESPPLKLPTLVVEVRIFGKAVTLVTTHLMPPLEDAGYDARNIHLLSVAEMIRSISGPRVLIGDLNTAMWGRNYRKFVEQSSMSNTRKGFGVLPTWPTQLPFAMIPIDHCLVSDDILVRDIRTGPDIGSDHLPLIVELALRADPKT
ncbi:MAG: hypothetical protein GWN47_09910 [Woeseiaceae bacterium]|nr:hypothetical protein [Woeseiaceae bacterium]